MSETNVLRKLQVRYFAPQTDITAYEVAEFLWLSSKINRDRGIMFKDETWEAMSPNLRRHFTDARPK